VTEEGADGLLTGRLVIWTHVYDGFRHYPEYMLIGQGVYDPMAYINSSMRNGLALPEIYHFHSTFIQTLWESGIPGFLLFVSFFVIFAWNAVRLIRDRSLPLWQRILPIPAVLCWLADMADCTGYCNWGKPPMTILYLFAGLTIAVWAERKRKGGKT
jgi:O-antigen ligase